MIREREIAKGLLHVGVVCLRPQSPFVWAGGITRPVYAVYRLILSSPEIRNLVEDELANVIKNDYPDAEMLMGTATAGIAHAAIVASSLSLPMGYVRSGTKDNRAHRIEGKLEKGEKVVVVEDLISTAKSSLDVVDVLREYGANVIGMVSIFTYGMDKGIDAMAAAKVKNISLCTLDTLIDVAWQEGYIKREEVAKILAFRANPMDESWMN
ncbi:MAG: orotate phosphoribosyltransferase [Clostridia bacterium]|nr:orotate phosphoribosyltransferase [Clostridia bacterium]